MKTDFQDISEFVKAMNTKRLENKDKWWTWVGTFKGKSVRIKCYNTWLQVFEVDGINHSSPMEMNVTGFRNWLFKPFNGA